MATVLDRHTRGLFLFYPLCTIIVVNLRISDHPVLISLGVSCLLFIGPMSMATGSNDSKITLWNLSTARAPGKTLVWGSATHSVDHSGWWLYGYFSHHYIFQCEFIKCVLLFQVNPAIYLEIVMALLFGWLMKVLL